jgi:hypothetical protein
MVRKCNECNTTKQQRQMKTTTICISCYNREHYSSSQLADADGDESKNIKPIFHPTLTIHSHLSIEKRASIVAFHRIDIPKTDIMQYIACSMPTVNHWIKHYDEHFNVSTCTHTHRPFSHSHASIVVCFD